MQNSTFHTAKELSAGPFKWRGFQVEHGDYAIIARLTPYKRNYVRKVLNGERKSAVVEVAAMKFYSLRKELTGE